jgi:hypothetical protein
MSAATVETPKILADFGKMKFDFATMEKFAGAEVCARFKEALVTGAKTSDADAKELEKALYAWCASNGCTNYAHW